MPEVYRPQVSVTITVAYDTKGGTRSHTVQQTWAAKHHLTADEVPDHVDEMVLRTFDQLKSSYHTGSKETP